MAGSQILNRHTQYCTLIIHISRLANVDGGTLLRQRSESLAQSFAVLHSSTVIARGKEGLQKISKLNSLQRWKMPLAR